MEIPAVRYAGDDVLYIPFQADNVRHMLMYSSLQAYFNANVQVVGHYVDLQGPVPILRKCSNTYSDSFANRIIYGLRPMHWGPLVPVGHRLGVFMRDMPGRIGDTLYGFFILRPYPEVETPPTYRSTERCI